MGWKEGEMDLVWDRSVSKADGNQLTLDAPLTMALDNKWGTVKVLRYNWPGRIAEAIHSFVEGRTIRTRSPETSCTLLVT